MTNTIMLLLVGFVILVKGADIFVESACSVAYIFRIPLVIIGIVIVGFGTSLPELSVILTAVLKRHDILALSTVLGTNIFNILFLLGTIACFFPIHLKKKMLKVELPYFILSAFLLFLFSILSVFFYKYITLTIVAGFLFLIFFFMFLLTLWFIYKGRREDEDEYHNEKHLTKAQELKVGSNVLSVLVGIVLVVYGGKLVVNMSILMIQHLKTTPSVMGSTILAVGTSLPEYTISVMAAIRRQPDLIIGNIIGSNIFNIFFVRCEPWRAKRG